MSKFKVGQIWADGYGDQGTIISIDGKGQYQYPIRTNKGAYTYAGEHYLGRINNPKDLTTLIFEPEVPQTEPKEVKLLTLQEVVATLTMDQVVGMEGTDWSWYYQWGVVGSWEIGLVDGDEKPMPMTHNNLTDRKFIIRDKSSLKEK